MPACCGNHAEQKCKVWTKCRVCFRTQPLDVRGLNNWKLSVSNPEGVDDPMSLNVLKLEAPCWCIN